MIGKIVTGKSFQGAVEYVLNKEKARLLDSDGVDTESARTVIDDLNFQRKTRPEVTKAVGHISLAFHKNDTARLNDELMTGLAQLYMRRMGITGTQYIIVRHTDTEHPHLHIVYNRVKYDRKLVSDKHERRRNVKICKEMKREYGLTFSQDKENVKAERLHTTLDRIKYEIYQAVNEALLFCDSMADLAAELDQSGIRIDLIHRGGDPAKEVQGITFTKDGTTLKGSQVDRKFSYGALTKRFEEQMPVQHAPSLAASNWDWSKFIGGMEADPAKSPERTTVPEKKPEPVLPREQEQQLTVQPKAIEQPSQRLVELAKQMARNRALKPKTPKKDWGMEL